MAAEDRSQRRRPEERTQGEYHILRGRMAAEATAQKIEKMTVDPVQNPGDWLYQLGVVLKRLAGEVGTIASFRADQKYADAKRLDAGEPPDPQALAYVRRAKLRMAKTETERQAVLDWSKKVESMRTTGPEYLLATCERMLASWPVAIYGARRLLRKIHDEGAIVFNEPAFLPARESIQEALACLVTIVDEGLSVVDDWKRACRVTEFEEDADDDEAVAEFFLHGGAFAEQLRGHKVQRRLEAVADRIRACSLTAGTEARKPLGRIAAVIYEKLKSLPEHRGMDTQALLTWLADRDAADAEGRDIATIDDGTLRGHLKQIEPYGLKNAPRIGYYVR